MTSLFDIVPQMPLRLASDRPCDDALPLTRWRASSAVGWNDQQFQQILSGMVETIRPFARDVAKALGARDPAAKIGAVLQLGRAAGTIPDTLATDLLASAMLLDSFAGNAAAQVALNLLRCRRGLPPVTWREMTSKKPLKARGSPRAAK